MSFHRFDYDVIANWIEPGERVLDLGCCDGGLLRYLGDIRPRLAIEPDEGVLFLAIDGEAMALNHLTVLASRYVSAAEIDGKTGSCHLFRHTMATLMLEGGADIRFIQQMLGHADLNTTQIYTQVSIRKLQAIHAATHPGARLARREQLA